MSNTLLSLMSAIHGQYFKQEMYDKPRTGYWHTETITKISEITCTVQLRHKSKQKHQRHSSVLFLLVFTDSG